MKIELKQFRQLYLTCEELCVAAAFMQVPCLYGVSGRWMKKRQGNLYKKVTQIAKGMERKNLLLPEISGEVHLQENLYDIVKGMADAEHVGRISYSSGEGLGKVFLYQKGEQIVFLEPDGKGSYHVGVLSPATLETIYSNKIVGLQKKQEFEKQSGEWMGVLLFEKRKTFYEPLMDFAWKQNEAETPEEAEAQLADCWECVCRFMCGSRMDGGNTE